MSGVNCEWCYWVLNTCCLLTTGWWCWMLAASVSLIRRLHFSMTQTHDSMQWQRMLGLSHDYVIWLAPWWRHISFCSLNLSLALWIKKPVMLENIAYLYSNVCIAYLPVIFMPSTGYVLQMVFCFLYVLLSWCMSRCSCEHGLVRRVGESITHMQPWRYHMTTVFSSLVYVVMFRSIKWCV